MDLRRQIAIIRRRFALVVLSVVLSGAAAFVGASLQPRLYQSDASLIVGGSLSTSNPDYNQILASQRLARTYASLATTRPLLARVIATLGLSTEPAELTKKVRAEAALDSTLLSVTAEDVDPVRAAAIANAIADELLASSPDFQGPQRDQTAAMLENLDATEALITSTQASVEELASKPARTAAEETRLGVLEGRLITLRQTYATLLSFLQTDRSNFLSVIEPAVPAEAPVSPRPLFSLLLGAVIGLLLSISILFVAEYFDDRVKTSEDVHEVLGLATLGTIPRPRVVGENERLVTLQLPRSAVADAYRTLGNNIEFAGIDSPVRTLLVTSAEPREGTTACAVNLAIVLAQSDRRVLLVDANLRDPAIHDVFNVPNVGMADLLRIGKTDAAGDVVIPGFPKGLIQATDIPGLQILAAGALPSGPAEILGSRLIQPILELAQADFDIVIIDSPALRQVSDPAILSSLVDASLLVIDAMHTRRGAVREAGAALARANARVLGAVLNRAARHSSVGFGPSFDRARESTPRSRRRLLRWGVRGRSRLADDQP